MGFRSAGDGFQSDREGDLGIFWQRADGTGAAERLTKPDQGSSHVPESWSQDGKHFLFEVTKGSTVSLWMFSPEDKKATSFGGVQSATPITAGFSPDGRWVAYTSNASGRDEIYVRPFMRAAADLQISSGGGSQPRWRRDGRELFYAAPDGRLMAVPIMASHDGQTIEAGTSAHLFSARLASGANVYQGQPQYAVAADGRFLVNVSTDTEAAPPISIVLNWDAALKK